MLACLTLLFYDYLLTLEDEVGYPIDVHLKWVYHPRERSNSSGAGGDRGVWRECHLLYDIC